MSNIKIMDTEVLVNLKKEILTELKLAKMDKDLVSCRKLRVELALVNQELDNREGKMSWAVLGPHKSGTSIWEGVVLVTGGVR